MNKRTIQAEYVTDLGASAITSVPVSTLRRWRHEKRGPRFCKLEGRLVRYKLSDLHAWVQKRQVA